MLPLALQRLAFDPAQRVGALGCHPGRRVGISDLLFRCSLDTDGYGGFNFLPGRSCCVQTPALSQHRVVSLSSCSHKKKMGPRCNWAPSFFMHRSVICYTYATTGFLISALRFYFLEVA